MNTTTAPQTPNDDTVFQVLKISKEEAAAGRMAESDQILARLAQAAPNHPAVLNELGVRMLARDSAEQAHALFLRATAADPRAPALWANLASSLNALGRRAEELDAIEKALEIEPRHLSALLQKGAFLEESGDARNAARAYQHALACVPPGAEPAPSIRGALEHGRAMVAADLNALTAALEQPLAEIRNRHGSGRERRVDQCLDILMGNRKAYHSQPTWMYFPELPEIEFFDRSQFPWLEGLEAATDSIRAELMNVLVTHQEGLQAYIDFPPSSPLDQFRELNRSRSWSAYFLWNQGTPNADHLARCPATARALEAIPRCRIESRAPTAFFSILDANTRIPAHVGVTNTRCTVHLPLIVPPDCGFRVGGTTREWVPGQAWVFDDTLDHEAWNLSDTPRAILIFDIWNPFLSAVERDMIQTATEIYSQYYSLPAEGSL